MTLLARFSYCIFTPNSKVWEFSEYIKDWNKGERICVDVQNFRKPSWYIEAMRKET